MVDDITVIRSMYTEAINHEPRITFIQTGQEQPGRPCIGSWIAYGLGSMNRDLPTFVVMNAKASHPKANTFEDTLVIWGGEFGRTIYSQGKLTPTDYGRDHHPRCFSLWMAGGGVKGGVVYGETDEFSYRRVLLQMTERTRAGDSSRQRPRGSPLPGSWSRVPIVPATLRSRR